MAHRMAYERFIGPIPNELLVCHKCDQPSCCNPGHLFVGTDADNQQDKKMKGRSLKGERCPTSKLTNERVLAIRLDDRTCKIVAADFGVDPMVISLIRRRKLWAHV